MDAAALAEVKDSDVVRRIADDLGISLEKADLLFEDLKLFLFISAQKKRAFRDGLTQSPTLQIDDDLYLLDQAWHTFLLFTETYYDFCQNFFGEFIHHHPVREIDRARQAEAFQNDAIAWQTQRKAEFEDELRFCAKYLPPHKLKLWFHDKTYAKPTQSLPLDCPLST